MESEIGYTFLEPELTLTLEEYLVYDLASFIGVIGGTIAIFLGVSVSEILSLILEMFRDSN